MAKLKQVWLCSFGLTKTFVFNRRFLAMAKLKQVWLCSFGLTKTFKIFQTPGQKLYPWKGGRTGPPLLQWRVAVFHAALPTFSAGVYFHCVQKGDTGVGCVFGLHADFSRHAPIIQYSHRRVSPLGPSHHEMRRMTTICLHFTCFLYVFLPQNFASLLHSGHFCTDTHGKTV